MLNISNLIDISVIKPLVIFYLIIANNYTGNLFAGQLKDYVVENRFAQHIIAFITLLVLINLYSDINNINKSLSYTGGIYLWFILTTKLDLHWNIMLTVLLLVGYMNENRMLDKEKNVNDDENIPKNIKNKIFNKNKQIRSCVVVGSLLVTLLGTYEYYNKKTVQYGGNFDPIKYLVCAPGNHKCIYKKID
jgi:hypothetical protein